MTSTRTFPSPMTFCVIGFFREASVMTMRALPTVTPDSVLRSTSIPDTGASTETGSCGLAGLTCTVLLRLVSDSSFTTIGGCWRFELLAIPLASASILIASFNERPPLNFLARVARACSSFRFMMSVKVPTKVFGSLHSTRTYLIALLRF